MFRAHIQTYSIRQSLPGHPAPSNTAALQLGERRLRPAQEHDADCQRAQLLHDLINRHGDSVVNRVLPIVDWTGATPLTEREVRVIRQAAREAQQHDEAMTSRRGMGYFGVSNRLHDGRFQGRGVTHSTGISHWLQSSRACDVVYKAIAPYEADDYDHFGIRGSGRGNLQGRNVATLETAHALNMPGMIPDTYVGHSELGPTLYMEHLRGIPLSSFRPDNLFTLSVPLKADDISLELDGWNQNLSALGLKIADYDDHRVRLTMAERSPAIHQVVPHDAQGEMVDGKLNRDLCRLAWLDLICGQADRNRSNILVDYDNEGRATRVMAIDNDMAFGEGVNESTVTLPLTGIILIQGETQYRGVPDVVDSETALSVLKLAAEPRRTQFALMLEANQLTESERRQALRRLDAAAAQINTWLEEANPLATSSTISSERQAHRDLADAGTSGAMPKPSVCAEDIDLKISLLTDSTASSHILPPEPENWTSISVPYSFNVTALKVPATTLCRAIQPQAIRAALQPRLRAESP